MLTPRYIVAVTWPPRMCSKNAAVPRETAAVPKDGFSQPLSMFACLCFKLLRPRSENTMLPARHLDVTFYLPHGWTCHHAITFPLWVTIGQVQKEHPGHSKADIADKLLKLWAELDPKVVERWDAGELP